jgi:membrane protein
MLQAFVNYVRHQSANQAGSVAFSAVLSSFPLLLFLSAAAAYVGRPGAAAELARRVVSFAPPLVVQTLQPVIDEVLSQRSRALVTVGLFFTVWTASSGVQAIRTALNKAYGVERGLAFWHARIKVILLTVIGTVGTALAFGWMIVLPYFWSILHDILGFRTQSAWVQNGVRYGIAFLVMTVLYAVMYAWLPDIRQRVRTVLPGALAGALMWVAAAAILSYTLRSVGKLMLIYGGLAGIVATLVFLYVSAVTLIFGAEINGVLREAAAEPATVRR